MERARLALESSKADAKAKEDKVGAGLILDPIVGPNQPNLDTLNIDDFKNDMAANEQYIAQSRAGVLNSDAFSGITDNDTKLEKLQQYRESYDKGEVITPIVAEYFRNTDRVRLDLDNKKAAMLNLEKAAPNLNDLTQGKTGMTIVKGQNKLFYSPTELVDFNSKYNELLQSIPKNTGGGYVRQSAQTWSQDMADSLFTSPKEKELLAVRKKQIEGQPLTENDKLIVGKLNGIDMSVNVKGQEVIKQRNEFLNKGVQDIMNQYKPELYGVDGGNTQNMYLIRNLVDRYLMNAKTNKKSVGASPNFNYDDAVKLNSDKANSTYSIYKKGNQAFIAISAGTGTEPQYIPVPLSELNQIYKGAFDRQFDPIEQTLALTNGRTTNVQNGGPNTAYFQKHDFPNVTKYGVTADIQKGQGGYQLQLHIYDPRIKQWVDKTPFYGTQAEVLNKVGTVGDLVVEQLLGLTPEQLQKLEEDKKK
jgi:hypothetical protein